MAAQPRATGKTDWTTRTSINFEVPLFYIVRRGLSDEQVEAAQAALFLTPCQAAFISSAVDEDLAWKLSSQVVYGNIEAAKQWAEEIGRPMLFIGEAEFIDAVFPDGKREALVAQG